ncbi:hypothetical protein LIER_20877 [Lithospermum erythrorhizon]|uniref:Uncharacterized protein n=1 Tax=Lithospermum erythrorhizon TaxID=34254 RepID=A0AAV3QS71_LITER
MRDNGLQEFINQVNKLKRLQFLTLLIDGTDEVCLPLLEELFFLASLVDLSIQGPINALPEYRDGLGRNLFTLKLRRCEMDTDALITLGKLPNLTSLRLDAGYFTGVKMTCHAMGFPKLKSLVIDTLPYLEMWEIENGAMPLLYSLSIRI